MALVTVYMLPLLAALFNVVFPAFIVIGVGAVVGYTLRLEVTPLNRLGLYATTPALVFSSLSNTEVGVGNVGRLLAAFVLMLVVMLGISSLASYRLSPSSRRGVIASSLFVNSANLMLPVTLFALGEAGVERAIILYIATTMLLYLVGPIIFAQGLPWDKRMRSVVALPVVWAALLALLMNILGWSFPVGVMRGVDLLAGAAIPIVLLVLGMQIQRTGLAAPSGINWLAAGLKLLVGPVVAFVASRVVGLSGIDLAVMTLFGSMPPAVMVFMLALEFSDSAEEVARTVVVSTLCALVTISIIVTLLGPL